MVHRHRSRGSTQAIPNYRVAIKMSEGDDIIQDFGTMLTIQEWESITDVTGRPRMFNPCKHERRRFKGTSQPPTWFVYYPVPPSGEDPYATTVAYPDGIITDELPTYVPPSSTEIQDFCWSAFIHATTQVPATVSVPNFLIELRELKSLLGGWKALFEEWKGKSLAQILSSLHLTWQFGIKPFLDDCKKICQAAKAARKRLQFLRDTYGKPTPVRYRREVSSEEGSGDPETIVGWSFESNLDPARAIFQLRKRQTMLYATIVTYHELQGLNSAMAFCDALAATTGFQNPIKVAWNALAFSWLLEYVVNLEHLLDSQQLPSFSGEIRVLESWFTMKGTTNYDVFCRNPVWSGDPPFTQVIGIPMRMGKHETKFYRRQEGLPLGSQVFLEDGLSESQLLILLALLGQKIQKRPRRKRKRRGA